jgi:hypothetical protein
MKPLTLKKIKLPLSTFWAMTEERRSTLLLLGLFLNEANWLMKLLVKAGKSLPIEVTERDRTPEEEASQALLMLVLTNLVGKIWEGWNCICNSNKLRTTLDSIQPSDELKSLKEKLKKELQKKLFVVIRNNVAFHYSDDLIDFSKLKDHLTERDAHLQISDTWQIGDALSELSVLASFEPILYLHPNRDPKIALSDAINDILKVTGLYSEYVYRALFTLIRKEFGPVPWEKITIQDAPEIDSEPQLCFFLHPPSNLEEIRSSLAQSPLE